MTIVLQCTQCGQSAKLSGRFNPLILHVTRYAMSLLQLLINVTKYMQNTHPHTGATCTHTHAMHAYMPHTHMLCMHTSHTHTRTQTHTHISSSSSSSSSCSCSPLELTEGKSSSQFPSTAVVRMKPRCSLVPVLYPVFPIATSFSTPVQYKSSKSEKDFDIRDGKTFVIIFVHFYP